MEESKSLVRNDDKKPMGKRNFGGDSSSLIKSTVSVNYSEEESFYIDELTNDILGLTDEYFNQRAACNEIVKKIRKLDSKIFKIAGYYYLIEAIDQQGNTKFNKNKNWKWAPRTDEKTDKISNHNTTLKEENKELNKIFKELNRKLQEIRNYFSSHSFKEGKTKVASFLEKKFIDEQDEEAIIEICQIAKNSKLTQETNQMHNNNPPSRQDS